MPFSTANNGIQAKNTSHVNIEGGNPSPSITPDAVEAPSHFLLSASFGKNTKITVNQNDNNMTNGHHPHNGNTEMRPIEAPQIINRIPMPINLGRFEGLTLMDCFGIDSWKEDHPG